MKVLFAASEGSPFIKTGGLGDVIGSLPFQLKEMGIDVRLVLPKYWDLPQEHKNKLEWLESREISLAWRKQFMGVESIEYKGIPVYFIDNEHYFKRPGAYGYGDDGERFAFFSKAVLEMLPIIDFYPDVLHCHDWQTAMIPVFKREMEKNHPKLKEVKTLFTIHNLKYQGIFEEKVLHSTLGLGWEYFTPRGLEHYGKINYMKGALNFSDGLSTVSPTYAKEIQDPFYGEGLETVIREKSYKLIGIINGIDPKAFDPMTDSLLVKNYSLDTLQDKELNKKALQRELSLPQKDVPVISIITRLVEQKGLDLVKGIIHELMALDLQLIILGTGDPLYEDAFRWIQKNYPDKCSAQIFFDNGLAQRIYAGSDLFLMPSLFEPCGLGQMIAMSFGTLPIVRETGGLKDTVEPYNEFTGEGDGFSFTRYNAHDLLFTVERALKFYQQKDKWVKIQRSAMKKDFSWNNSAKEYQKLYKKILT